MNWYKIISIILALCLLAGCGGGDYVPTGNGLTPDGEETVNNSPIDSGEEQTLTLTYYRDKSMNPLLGTDYTNRALFSLVYQGLFSVDRDYNPRPVLCKNYTVSKDMKTYTFYLEEATFSDGSVLTVQDVVASLQAAKESAYYGGRFQYVSDISLSSDGGVTISLRTGYENLPLLLDIPIVREAEVAADNPLGTGPYVFTGQALHRRSDWWCNASMTITAREIGLVEAENNTQIRDEFEFGELNLVCADPGSERYTDYRGDYELWDCENGIFLYIACCSSSTVFSNPKVRAALTHAIDREMLVDDYYRGFARAATLPASPLFPHYSNSLAERYAYDPLKFTEVLKEEGLRDSTVKLLVNKEDTLRLRVARQIGKMLSDCGLTVQMEELSGKNYQYALSSWGYDLYVGQTKLSANMDLSAFFSSYGSLSYGGLEDVMSYTLCQQALENHGNYYTLHQTVMENGMLCPVLFRSYSVYATRGLLTGLTPSRDNVFYYSLGKTLEQALIPAE